jgi:hypothetical protein
MTTFTPFPFVFVGDGIVEEDPNEWLRQVKLFALSRGEGDKIKVFELCLAPGSPAEAWYDNLDPDKMSFKSICQAFQKTFPGMLHTPLPAWIPLERLEMCVLREEDLGRDIEEEGTGFLLPAHVAYARRIQKLSAAVPGAEAQLVANARHHLPPSVRAIVPKHAKSWDAYVDAIMQVTSSDLLKIQERSGGVPGGAAYGGGAAPNLSRHESSRRSSYPRTASNGYANGAATGAAASDFPAPHIVEFANGSDTGSPDAVPVHISSGSEAGSPTNVYGPNYSPSRTMANGRPYYATASPTHMNGFSASPYDRDTPSAPPMAQTRTWLSTNGSSQPGAARAWRGQ